MKDISLAVNLKLSDILSVIDKKEKEFKAMEPLVFIKAATGEPVKLKKSNDTQSFVRKFFEKFNREYNTIVKSSKQSYCTVDTRRSTEDIFRIAYSYLGDKITLKDVIIATYERVISAELTANNCYQINKRVYKDRPNSNGTFYNPSNTDEYGFNQQHYKLLTQ